MKTKILAALVGAGMVVLAVGCVRTVGDNKTMATTWGEDRFTGRYQRSPDDVYRASVAVIKNNGVLLTEIIPHNVTNSVRAVYGKVNDRKVWIRVEPVDPTITQVTVEARTKLGWTDQDLVHELEKEIALQLQAMR